MVEIENQIIKLGVWMSDEKVEEKGEDNFIKNGTV